MGRGASGGAESAALIYVRLIVETGGVGEESTVLIYVHLIVKTGGGRDRVKRALKTIAIKRQLK